MQNIRSATRLFEKMNSRQTVRKKATVSFTGSKEKGLFPSAMKE
jgi:hypothetical protein